jgi:hypothetical protein
VGRRQHWEKRRPHRRTGRPWRPGQPYRTPLKWHQYFVVRAVLFVGAVGIVASMCATP